jgi:hypothetical protein
MITETAPIPDHSIGLEEFYGRMFRAAIDGARAGQYMTLSVWGCVAARALDTLAADIGVTVEHDEYPSQDQPVGDLIRVARIVIPSTGGSITVHLS